MKVAYFKITDEQRAELRKLKYIYSDSDCEGVEIGKEKRMDDLVREIIHMNNKEPLDYFIRKTEVSTGYLRVFYEEPVDGDAGDCDSY